MRKHIVGGQTFDMRGKYGQQWAKAVKHDEKLRKGYTGMSTQAEKREFRNRWLAERCEALRQERIKR
eukprot:5709795-Alexandrium_andersonii.AAC.1